ncbi:MAG: hypothetical protein OHK0044_13890 [Burkholderiaceae bacterium]
MAVPADDDVVHLQLQHRELDGRGGAVKAGGRVPRRHEVADVARDEQLAGPQSISAYGTMRESEQPMNSVFGRWPFSTSRRSVVS